VRYFVELRGETFEIELGPTRDGRTIAKLVGANLDGVEHVLEVASIEAMKRMAVAVDGRVHDVQLGADARGLHVTLDGTRHDVAIEDERERAAHQTAGAAAKGPVVVKSAMPGIIRAVLVKAGDAVAAGQPLVILEAMKMENELRADHAGVVREVKVGVGVPVDGGAELVVLDPPAAAG
jgi:acetyl/propionyl-CoA carboxylase alpha subunit